MVHTWLPPGMVSQKPNNANRTYHMGGQTGSACLGSKDAAALVWSVPNRSYVVGGAGSVMVDGRSLGPEEVGVLGHTSGTVLEWCEKKPVEISMPSSLPCRDRIEHALSKDP